MLPRWLDFLAPGRRERREMVDNLFDKWESIYRFETSPVRMQQKHDFYKPYIDFGVARDMGIKTEVEVSR
jgi:hypothetical protein